MEISKEHAGNEVPETCRYYLEEKDKSNQIYRLEKEAVTAKTGQLLKESLELNQVVPAELQKKEEYQTLERVY